MQQPELAAPSVELDDPAVRVIGGETVFVGDDNTQRYPGYVQLRIVQRNVLGADASTFTCGGAVVHAWTRTETRLAGFWVATAAHCLKADNEYQVALWTGEGASAGQPVALSPFVRISNKDIGPWRLLGPQGIVAFKHPLYSDKKTEHDYDIALLRVVMPPGEDLPVTLAQGADPAWNRIPQMARQRPVRNTEATILGFGLTEAPTSEDDPSVKVSPTLQKLRVAIEPTNFRWRGDDTNMSLWVVGVPTLLGQKISSVCNGDSGGPLLVEPASGNASGAPSGQELQLPPVLAGVLCCGYCKVVERREDLASKPSIYTRIDTFMGPPTGEAAELLKTDSVWHHGLEGIIARHSPTLYRTTETSQLAPASVVAPEVAWAAGDMVWVEGPGRRDLGPTFMRGTVRLVIVIAIALAIASVTVPLLRAIASMTHQPRKRQRSAR